MARRARLRDLGHLEAFDAAHDDADKEASHISNGGLNTQIEALANTFGITAA